jgi:hypothetical protein
MSQLSFSETKVADTPKCASTTPIKQETTTSTDAADNASTEGKSKDKSAAEAPDISRPLSTNTSTHASQKAQHKPSKTDPDSTHSSSEQEVRSPESGTEKGVENDVGSQRLHTTSPNELLIKMRVPIDFSQLRSKSEKELASLINLTDSPRDTSLFTEENQVCVKQL